jgi:hypothetical protein
MFLSETPFKDLDARLSAGPVFGYRQSANDPVRLATFPM